MKIVAENNVAFLAEVVDEGKVVDAVFIKEALLDPTFGGDKVGYWNLLKSTKHDASPIWRDSNVANTAKNLLDKPRIAAASTANPAEPQQKLIAVPPGYEALAEVLEAALQQAASGKGKERHANGKPFHQQPIMEEAYGVGIGFPAGQARKKILEATRGYQAHPQRAIADLLGAINYAAATVIYINEVEDSIEGAILEASE